MTPLDSFLRGHVKTGVYASTQGSSVEIAVRITNAIYEISEQYLKNIFNKLQYLFEGHMHNYGGYIES
jgi:uncharacterized protein (DUF2141 family)